MPRQPRQPNGVKTEAITLRTTEEVCRDLDTLLDTGRFGKSRAEVAEQLLRERLRDLIREGWTGSDSPANPRWLPAPKPAGARRRVRR